MGMLLRSATRAWGDGRGAEQEVRALVYFRSLHALFLPSLEEQWPDPADACTDLYDTDLYDTDLYVRSPRPSPRR